MVDLAKVNIMPGWKVKFFPSGEVAIFSSSEEVHTVCCSCWRMLETMAQARLAMGESDSRNAWSWWEIVDSQF